LAAVWLVSRPGNTAKALRPESFQSSDGFTISSTGLRSFGSKTRTRFEPADEAVHREASAAQADFLPVAKLRKTFDRGIRDLTVSGSLPGTNTMLVRRSDGRNFAVLFNARETQQPGGLSSAAAAEINRVLDGIKELPAVDYFEAGEK